MKSYLAILLFGLPASLLAATDGSAMRRHASAALGGGIVEKVWTSADGVVGAFNHPGGGFALATADGVVGYSPAGEFSPAGAPPALLEILEHVRTSEVRRAARGAAITPVAPLLGAMAWDQTEPYNLLCPAYYGTQRSATGCAATAMAQIMRYHSWPECGQGSHSYEPEFYPSMGTISVDFSQSVYDWERMTPVYNSASSRQEREAVARLMYDAGVAVSMNYGPVSGAMSQDWPAALVEYFGYDPGVAIVYRAYYDIEGWEDTIVEELSEGRPIYVTGFTDAGGHAFVFDGIDSSGMVHVNWGWSGMSNGYFDTAWLTPSTQGTGGSAGGFNARQMMVTRIMPPGGEPEPAVSFVSEEALTVSPRVAQVGTPLSAKLNGKIENVGWQPSEVDFGLLLAEASGAPVAEVTGLCGVTVVPGTPYRTLQFSDVDFGDLADGDYRLYPVARAAGGSRWERIRDKDVAFPNYLLLKVEGGDMTFSAPEMASLHVSGITLHGNLYAGMKTRVTANVANAGGTDYSSTAAMALFSTDTGKRVATADYYNCAMAAGAEGEVEFFATFDVAPGEYSLAVTDPAGILVSDKLPVTVLPGPASDIRAVEAPDFGDNNAVDPMAVHASVKVSVPEGAVFSGQLFLYVYEADGSAVQGCFGPEYVQVTDAGSPATVTFSGSFENAVPGCEYDVCLVNGETFSYVTPRDIATARIRIAGESALSDSHSDSHSGTGAAAARYFNMQGTPLANPPASGLYIEVCGGKAYKRYSPSKFG